MKSKPMTRTKGPNQQSVRGSKGLPVPYPSSLAKEISPFCCCVPGLFYEYLTRLLRTKSYTGELVIHKYDPSGPT